MAERSLHINSRQVVTGSGEMADAQKYLPHPMTIKRTGKDIDVAVLESLAERIKQGHEEYFRQKAMGRRFDRKAGCYK